MTHRESGTRLEHQSVKPEAPTRLEHQSVKSEAPKRRAKKKNSKALYYVLLAVLLAVLVFSAVKIISYLNQQRLSENQQEEISSEFITPLDDNGETGTEGGGNISLKPGEPQPEQIQVDFEKLLAKYPDVVGYIYGANTGINYPVVKGVNNDYYLNHDYDGKTNNNGAIFLEECCSRSFSNSNCIIYGHHMKSGLMFAALEKYKSQSFYDAHPCFYLYTPTQNYRLDIFAGSVVEGDSAIYALSPSAETIAAVAAKSTFNAKIGVPAGNIVTLSTCDYTSGYSDPRYVVLAEMVPID